MRRSWRSPREAALAFEPATDVAATVSALALIPVVLTSLSTGSATWVAGDGIADWAIWSIFAVDAVTKAVAYGRGWLRRSSAWLDLAILAVTFPAMPLLLSELRLVRLVNLARMGRVMAVVRLTRLLVLAQRAGSGLRRILSPEAFPVLFVTALLLVLIGAAGLQVAESDSGVRMRLSDALWWAVVTVTSVGYGDIVPKTSLGRTVAGIVMVVGIAFTSLLTAQIAAWLSRQKMDESDEETHAVIKRLDQELRVELRGLRREVEGLSESIERLSRQISADRDEAGSGGAPHSGS